MSLYARLLKEKECDEGERSRGRSSGRDEDRGSPVFSRRAESTFRDRPSDQRRTDLRRIRSYLTYQPKNRWEAAHLASLREKYHDEYWDLRYGRL